MRNELKLLLLAIAGCFAINPASADVNPWAWKVNYTGTHGIWKTICDEQNVEEEQLNRCYVRWVDVFSERPKFGALYVFITPENNGFAVDFSVEPGTTIVKDGFAIVDGEQPIWKMERSSCLVHSDCKIRPDEMQSFFSAAERGEKIAFSLIDRYEQQFELNWSLDGFNEAMADLKKQLQKREAN